MFRVPNYYQKIKTKNSFGSIESVFIKNLNFIGLQSDTVKQRITSSEDTNLNITPKVYNRDPSNNPPSLFFDFNSINKVTDQNRSDLVSNFFGKLGVNNTNIKVTHSGYDYNNCSLDGSYTFLWIQNNIVHMQGISLINYDSSKLILYPEKFTETPIFTLNNEPPHDEILIPLPAYQFRITNKIPCGTNSFIVQGIAVGSILEYGEDKYRVIDVYLNAKTKEEELILDKKEFLVKDGKSSPESDIDDLDQMYMFNLYKQK
jgi:hypothetical protein